MNIITSSTSWFQKQSLKREFVQVLPRTLTNHPDKFLMKSQQMTRPHFRWVLDPWRARYIIGKKMWTNSPKLFWLFSTKSWHWDRKNRWAAVLLRSLIIKCWRLYSFLLKFTARMSFCVFNFVSRLNVWDNTFFPQTLFLSITGYMQQRIGTFPSFCVHVNVKQDIQIIQRGIHFC